jgi:hypothetical protein
VRRCSERHGKMECEIDLRLACLEVALSCQAVQLIFWSFTISGTSDAQVWD